MGLSWFGQLFGKKKVSPAHASATAAPVHPSRYRASSSVAMKAAPTALAAPTASYDTANHAPRPFANDSELEPLPVRHAPTAAAVSPLTIEPHAAPPTPERLARPDDRNNEIVHATKMALQEELSIKLSEGLKGLSQLLSSIDDKLGQQSRATELVADRLQTLPRVLEGLVEAERVNLDVMRELRGSMEKQSEASARASEQLERLPTVVDTIGGRIEKQTEASASVKTAVESVGQSVRSLVDGAQRAQGSLVTEFRRGQDEQRQQLEALVERQRKTILVVAAIGALVVIVLFVVIAKLPR